jgi:beta-lactamase regulating signal transducer with metallopeptidase domain
VGADDRVTQLSDAKARDGDLTVNRPTAENGPGAAIWPEELASTDPVEGSAQRVIDLFCAIWIAGAVGVLFAHAVRIRRLWRMINGSAQAPPPIADEIARQARDCGLRPPAARVCSSVSCPVVVALPRAMLLWPSELDARLDSAARQAVIAHELAHLKRRDHLTAWLEVAAACIWWWHPVLWLARRELREYAELACDAWVVARSPSDRGLYAKALVDVCECVSQAKIAAAPAVGMARGARRSFERRLTMILRQRISARMSFVAWLAIVGVAVLVLPGFSTGQDEPKKADPGESVESKGELPTPTEREPLKTVDLAVESPAAQRTSPVNQPRTVDTGDPTRDAFTSNTRASDEYLLRQVAPNRRAMRLERSKGGPLDAKQVEHVAEVLMPLVKRMRGQLPSGRADEYIVNEIYLHMLDRMPTASESKIWVEQLKQNDDAAIRILVAAIGQSAEFSGNEETFKRLTHKPRVQTLLRVSYEMPTDKANALAVFIKENVLQPIDVRVVEPGLVVTAEGEVQAPIAAMVSLITGERVVLDLDQHGRHPTGAYRTQPAYGPPTMEGYLPRTQDGSRAGIFPPVPRQAEPSKRKTGGLSKETPASFDGTTKEPPVVVPTRP